MLNEGEVYFGLFGGDFDPASLSIGVTPTTMRRKGNPRPKYSSWIYSTGKRKAEPLDVSEMASSLVASLEPCAEKIIEAKRTHELKAV